MWRRSTSPGDILGDDTQFLPHCTVHQLAQRLLVERMNMTLDLESWREGGGGSLEINAHKPDEPLVSKFAEELRLLSTVSYRCSLHWLKS